MTRPWQSSRGIALVLALLAVAFFSAVAGGLVLSSLVGRSVAANYEESTELANVGDSALELAARELAQIANWNDVLGGARTSAIVDGLPGRRVLPDGTTIDLIVLTNERTCGRAGPCTNAQVSAYTSDRPWGPNNPRWRLFVHAPFPALPALPRPVADAYVVVWIGDDAREIDGDPVVDGGGAGLEGRYVVRARVESFGARGARHTIEAELARACLVEAGIERCAPGVRVLAWRAATAAP